MNPTSTEGIAAQQAATANHVVVEFLAAYTWSHTIDNSTADFFSTVITPRRPQDFQNINADKSSSALDHRNRFSIAAYYDLPYFKNGN